MPVESLTYRRSFRPTPTDDGERGSVQVEPSIKRSNARWISRCCAALIAPRTAPKSGTLHQMSETIKDAADFKLYLRPSERSPRVRFVPPLTWKIAMRLLLARQRRRMVDEYGRPVAAGRDYDRAEITADAVVHGVGLTLGVVGVAILLALVTRSPSNGSLAGALIYAVGLLAMLAFSAAYNLWPLSRMKWLLRRFDHSAIYLLIAATYTPFIAQIKQAPFASTLLALVWAIAAVGIVIKLALPGRLDRLSVLLYLLLSWSGVMMYDVIAALPLSTLWFLGVGGLVYTFGVIFHFWSHLRFQNAIWHTFVVVAAACHYAAVLDYFARA